MGLFKKIIKETKRTAKRVKKEASRTTKRIEKETKRMINDIDRSLNSSIKDIEHITSIDIKPIVKAIAGPAHILVKIAEGHNLSEATTDWVVNQVDGAGEIGGVFGSDIENVARTIVSYSNIPVLVLVNLAGDTIKVAEGEENLGDMLGSPLKTLITHAHALYDKHATPLPFELRFMLKDVVKKSILQKAKYVIDKTPDNVAGLANKLHHGSSNIHAVTLDNIIVFSRAPNKDLGGYLHWIHELKHVEQYQNWGILEFASRYTLNSSDVEDDAKAASIAAQPFLKSIFQNI